MTDNRYNLIVILGPTASGKTPFAAHLATHINAEIISADSRQVYKDMTLGTGKDIADYTVGDVHVPYHLIDIAEAGSKYNVFRFQNDFFAAFDDITSRGRMPLMCGGTGMYIEAVLKGYRMTSVPPNEELRRSLEGKSLAELTERLATYRRLHNNTDSDTVPRAIRAIEIEEYYANNPVDDVQLPTLNPLVIGLDIDRELRREKITRRLHARLAEGMVDEVKALLERGIAPEDLIYYGLEYKYLTQHVVGELTYDEMVEQLNIAIHQFAKRQMTWFRGMERRGTAIHWIDASLAMDEKVRRALELIDNVKAL